MKKVIEGAVIAAVGAGLTYLLQNAGGLNFGIATPAVVALLTALVHLLQGVGTSDAVKNLFQKDD